MNVATTIETMTSARLFAIGERGVQLIRGRQVSASQMNAQIHAAVSAFWGVRLDTAIATNAGETCRYLVVNRAASSAAVLTYVQQLAAERIASDESRDLYRIRD